MITTRNRKSFPQKKNKKEEKKNKGVFVETYAVAPSPSRDYYALQVYQKKFLWTRWKISHGPFVTPLQKTVSLDQFLKDPTLQNELTYIFGSDTTNLIKDLANQKWTLITMPTSILHKIFSYISVPDILRLSQVCKRLSKECSTNELWQTICKKQWKILLHNDAEKAALIGWKRVYLEKMRPKRYKTEIPRQSKPNPLHRNRVQSASTLNTPESRSSVSKSNFTIHKRIQELKKTDASRSSSEIFGKEYKITSTSTGKSTERSIITKARPYSRNSDAGSLSGRLPSTHKTSQSVINLVKVPEKLKENESVNKVTKASKCKVTSIRSVTSQLIQPTEGRSVRSRADTTRPNTGKSTKTKH